MPLFIQDHMEWWLCGIVVVLGIVVYGFGDLVRLSFGRVWAIASVCFAESVRRKIWLITPLAIIGVIVVAQLQRPDDERDAIRQTAKFCLFATGLLVTLTAVILACTNLPREIENRVIYTVVTKPTTRLEIVLGKVIGFARVSALILIIMGLFTFCYLHFRAWRFESAISARLAMPGEVDAVSRPAMEYYRDAGLLAARVMANTDDMEIYTRLPEPGDDRRWFSGTGETDVAVPFDLTPAQLVPNGAAGTKDAAPGMAGIHLLVQIGAERIPGYVDPAAPPALPPTIAAPSTQPAPGAPAKPAAIFVQILDNNQSPLVSSRDINLSQPIVVDPTGQRPVDVVIPPQAAQAMYKPGADMDKTMRISVQIVGASPGYNYFMRHDPVQIIVPAVVGHTPLELKPPPDPNAPDQLMQPMFRGREGTSGQQIRGDAKGGAPVAVYRFTGATPQDETGDVTFEFKSGIERSDEGEAAENNNTQISAVAFDRDSKQASPPIQAELESNHQSYFKLPAQFLKSGNFDIQIRCKSDGQYLGLFASSLGMIRSLHGFDFNLIKSLLIMWLMAILVITVAIFTSTFLSWPTAIVLTMLILLGRWGIEQLGDATQPGIGNMIATDMGFTDPNKAKVVSTVTEALATGLNNLAKVLPDISQFSASEDIERGLVVPVSRLTDALQVLLCYGLATLALAYVRLTYTEVAP